MSAQSNLGPAAATPQDQAAAAVSAGPDQSAERLLVAPANPVAFVYLDLDSFGEDERALRWTALMDSIREQGAPEPAIMTLTDREHEAPLAPATLAAFADSDGTLLHVRRLTGTRLADRAGFAAPACVIPLLTWDQHRPPYVLAVVDRTGADLTASAGDGQPPRTLTVAGPDDEIERNAPGGWSQPRYQRRAEDSWRHNATAVAAEIVMLAAQVKAQVLVLAGDLRAVQLVVERVPRHAGLTIQHIAGSRSPDGSQTHRPEHVDKALRDAAALQNRLILDHFSAHLEPGGLAVEGVTDTVAALAAERVATLLVSDEPDDRRLWFGDEAGQIYPDHELAAASGNPVRVGPLTDVAIRAALLSGARVRVLDADDPVRPADGIGGICRYTVR